MLTLLGLTAALALSSSSGAQAATAARTAAAGPGIQRCLGLVSDPLSGTTGVVLETCDQSAGQQWQLVHGTLQIAGRCVQTVDQGSADGTPVELGSCDGRPDQGWSAKGGELVNEFTGKCLAAPPDADTGAVNTRLVILACQGGPNQFWTRTAIAAGGTPVKQKSPTWLPGALVAIAAATAALLIGLAAPGRAARRTARGLRSLLPRRPARISPAARLLLSDPELPATAARALSAAGRGGSWWPYAVLVSDRSATVWLAGLSVPEPPDGWSGVPDDERAWTIARDALTAAAEPDLSPADTVPVVLGALGDAIVVLDVSRAHGTLVIGGDSGFAQRVHSAVAEQVAGGEVVLRDADIDAPARRGRPHWDIEVDDQGWITVHGRRVLFAEPQAVAAVAVPAVSASDGTADKPERGTVAVSAVSSVDGADAVEPLPEPLQQGNADTVWENKAVSSASTERSPRPRD